ncbi:hypothetical protein BRX37_19305 [Sphingomonas sp. S-NIH.Pt3_0716]|nr:hypothetical protein BRX37_19305 [Sphingomonas sp. S-NIH.Pt3_0716]
MALRTVGDVSSIVEWAAALATVAGACGLVTRAITKDVARDVVELRKDDSDLRHSLKNQATRIDAIEHLRTADVERIVKLESAVQSFDKAIERVERGQEKLATAINDRFDILAESIREIRIVTPKG